MKRPWSEDWFFCFECRHFGGQDKCHKFNQILSRKGWQQSCDKFESHELFRNRERQAAEAAERNRVEAWT